MTSMPRLGQRVRFGALAGTVVRIFADILKAEVLFDSGLSVTLDILAIQPEDETA